MKQLFLFVIAAALLCGVQCEQSDRRDEIASGKEMDDMQDYAIELLMAYFVAPAVFAALWLVLGTVYGCCRCCCHSCGFRNEEKTFSHRERWGYRGAMWILTLIVLITSSVGLGANAGVSGGLEDFTDALIKATAGLMDAAAEVRDGVKNLFPDAIEPGTFAVRDQIVESCTGLVNATKSFVDVSYDFKELLMDTIDMYRVMVMSTGYASAYILYLVGSVAALFQMGKLSSLMMYFIFLPQTFMFLMMGLHHLLAVLLADVCIQVEAFITGDKSEGNFIVDQFCTFGSEALEVTGWLDTCLHEIETKKTNNDAICDSGVCDKQIAAIKNIQTGLVALLDCKVVRELISGVETAICKTVLDSVYSMYETQITIGVMGFLGFFVAAKGVKRYPKSANANNKTVISATEMMSKPGGQLPGYVPYGASPVQQQQQFVQQGQYPAQAYAAEQPYVQPYGQYPAEQQQTYPQQTSPYAPDTPPAYNPSAPVTDKQ